MTIAESIQQVSAAEFQVAQQRAEAQSAQQKSAEQLRQIETAQQKLPSTTSQSALRQKMAGMAGLVKRKAIEKVKTALGGKRTEVQQYQKGIEAYKGELTKYELEKIAPVKAQIAQAQAHDAAVERIKEADKKGMVWALAMYGEGIVKELAQKYEKQESIAREALQSYVQKQELVHPGEKLVVDWKNLKVTGVQSGSLGQTLSLKEYNKKVSQFKPEEIKMEEFQAETIPGITEQSLAEPTFLQKVKSAFTGAGIQTVSALPSDDTGLKTIAPSKVNDIDVSTREVDRVGVIPSVRDFISRRIIGDSKEFKEGFKEEETKARITGGVVSAYVPYEGKAYELPEKTFVQKITDLPSRALESARDFSERQASLVSTEQLMGIGNVGSMDGRDIIGTMQIAGRAKIASRTESQITDLDKTISDLTKNKVNELNEFTGTQTEYDRLVKLESKRENLYNKYQAASTMQIGLRERSVQEFRGLTRNPLTAVGSSLKLGAAIVGGAAGVATKESLDYFGYKPKVIPEQQVLGFEEQYGTVQMGQFGKETPFYKEAEYIIPERVRTSETIGVGVSKVTEAGIDFGKYFVPGGGIFFGADVAGFGADVAQTKFVDKEKLTREQKVEGLFLGGLALGVSAFKGVKLIKNKAITKVISKKITALEKTPLKSLTFVDEGSGVVYAEGIRSIEGVEQTVRYYGKIKTTESGVKFIPSGEGAIVTAGKISPKVSSLKLKERQFISGTEFELGARGKNVFVKNIGDIKVFEELGTTSVIPKKDFFGITKETGKKGAKELERQLKKGVPSDPLVIKDISIPTDQRNLFFEIKKGFGLRASPQEVGTVITIPKKIDQLGFKGAGKKSSDKFFKDLYAPQAQKKPVLDLPAPQVSEIAAKVKTKVPKLSSKVSTQAPVSAYAGTGLYERTDSVVAPLSLSVQPQQSIVKDTFQIPKAVSAFRIKEFQRGKQKDFLSLKPKSGLTLQPKSKLFQQPKVKTDLAVSQVSKVGQATKQVTRPTQRAETIQRPLTRVTTKPKPTMQKVFKFPLRIKPVSKKRKTVVVKKKRPEEFLAITKKKGKEVVVGVAMTAKRAEMIAKKDVLGTLGATVKVRTRAGRQVQLAADKTFRLSKTDPLAIVQKKTRRLAAVSERRAISKARKKRFSLK